MPSGAPDVGDDLWSGVLPATRAGMLRGAVIAFGERGFHATSTRDIALAAGMSPAALYAHYPTKAALLAHIARRGHEAARDLVGRTLDDAPPGDPVVRLRAVTAALTAWHARNRGVARVIAYELPALPDEDRRYCLDLRRRVESAVTALLTEGVEAGVMGCEPRRVARAVLSLAGDVPRWYDPQRHEPPEDLAALYADLAARMVGASPSCDPPRAAR